MRPLHNYPYLSKAFKIHNLYMMKNNKIKPNNILLVIYLIIVSLLTNCSFHTATSSKQIHAFVEANSNNKTANIIKNSINNDINSNWRIKISPHNQSKTINSLDKNIVVGHKLTVNLPVKIYHNNKLIFSKTITSSIHSVDANTSLTNNLQDEQYYQNLRQKIANKLLIKLSYIITNANKT